MTFWSYIYSIRQNDSGWHLFGLKFNFKDHSKRFYSQIKNLLSQKFKKYILKL